jgi:formylglycine-generating enzyme required for sulfatase activity
MPQTLFFLVGFLFLAATSPNTTRLPHFRPGKDYALFFAIENYSNGWSKLQYPIDDAEAIANDLRNLYGFQVELLRNASKTEIQDKLLEYGRKTYAPDAQLFVFFSGHGEFYEATKEGFIIPTSGKRPDTYQDSYISHDRLKKAVDAIPCNHILLAIDACYSGTIDDRIASKGGDNKPQWKLPAGPDLASAQNQQFIKDNLKYRTRFYLTSGGKEQTPDRSVFAQKFLEALRSTSVQNPVLTFTGLQSFLEKVNPVPRAGEFGVTEPGLKNFLFIRHQDDTRDSDYDGIPDTRDECPTVYAKTPSGCLDSDEDGTPDHKDNCKYEPGPANNAGCPTQAADSDGDGIPDAGDACPTEKGLARFAGCPDTDADGIPDKDDQCPQQKGPASNRGCPLAPDRDADGTPDNTDRCPDQYGPASNGGCPLPPPVPNGMVLVKGGTFEMGDVMGDKQETNETVHTVTVSDFLLAKNELTFEEYDAFCKATSRELPADEGWGRGQRPVINVDWYDAVEYCNWRSTQENLQAAYSINKNSKDASNSNSSDTKKWTISLNRGANGYRLPSEAEWEYAARAGGKKVRFGNGKDIADTKEINFDGSASYKKNYSLVGEYRAKTVPVGSLNSPNALQLHDLSGNVWEWCWDWYGTYPSTATTNPLGATGGSPRVCRGGSWYGRPIGLRVADRRYDTPSNRNDVIGFRLARAAVAL